MMRLLNLSLQNFRFFENLNLDLDPKLTILIAPNGQEKTAVLDALAIALSAFVDAFSTGVARPIRADDVRLVDKGLYLNSMMPRFPSEVSVEAEMNGECINWQRRLSSFKTRTSKGGSAGIRTRALGIRESLFSDDTVTLPVIAYFGTGRLWAEKRLLNSRDLEKTLQLREAGYKHCLDPASDYRYFSSWFESACRIDYAYNKKNSESPVAPLLEAVRRAIEMVVSSQTGWKDLDFTNRLEMSHKSHGTLAVAQLSDGVRNLLALTADIAYRCVQLNPHLGAEAALLTPGVVLIDEIDMHLHPGWQQNVIPDLLDAFPMIQFIMSTHSPQAITAVMPESVRILRDQLAVVPQFSYGAESFDVMDALFGVKSRPLRNDAVIALAEYRELISTNSWDSEEARILRRQLESHGMSFQPALLRADMDIRMRGRRRPQGSENEALP